MGTSELARWYLANTRNIFGFEKYSKGKQQDYLLYRFLSYTQLLFIFMLSLLPPCPLCTDLLSYCNILYPLHHLFKSLL
jgi:hypothetical protein